MNSLRIRVVKLATDYGVGEDNRWGVNISTDNLFWWTISRHQDEAGAEAYAKAFAIFVQKNQLARATHIKWTGRV